MKGLMVYQNKKTSDGTDTCGHGGHAKSCKGLDHKDLWSFTIPRGRLQRQRPHKTQMPHSCCSAYSHSTIPKLKAASGALTNNLFAATAAERHSRTKESRKVGTTVAYAPMAVVTLSTLPITIQKIKNDQQKSRETEFGGSTANFRKKGPGLPYDRLHRVRAVPFRFC